jgi:hypothetical protein
MHPVYEHWFKKGGSRSEAGRRKVDVNENSLKVLLKSGVSDEDEESDRGFSASLWNNRDDASAAFSVFCGAHSNSAHVKNSFVLDFPRPASISDEFHSEDLIENIFKMVVECWDPKWATFVNRSIRDSSMQRADVPVVGWLTYTEINLPASVGGSRNFEVTNLSNGSLVTAGPDPFQVTDAQIAEIVDFLPPDVRR